MTDKIHKKLMALFPDLTGTMEINSFGEGEMKAYTVKAQLSTAKPKLEETIKKLMEIAYPGSLVSYDVSINDGLQIIGPDNTVATEYNPDAELDEVKILYVGMMETHAITPASKFKTANLDKEKIFDDCVKVLGFISPLVLDQNLKVIDGDFRLHIAKNNEMKRVPVVVIQADTKRADFLRLVLNRSSEFQRWVYDEVDPFIDSIPQVQPLLEPWGFFGLKVLPTTFFGPTVLDYKLDEFNSQQSKYKQEMGLVEWAAIMRERMAAESKAKAVTKGKAKTKGAVSLFDLTPETDDFLPTHNIEAVVNENVQQMRELAGNITDAYDEVRRPILEAQGKWQGTRRTSQAKAADLRAAAGDMDIDTEAPDGDLEAEVVQEAPVESPPKSKSKPKANKPAPQKTLAEIAAERKARLAERNAEIKPSDKKEFNIDDYKVGE